MTDLALSVVIPSRGRRVSVERLLRALLHQTMAPAQFEVIVSVNGPEDGTSEMVAGFSSAFALKATWQAAAGRAAACNAGVREARGNLIVLLDDDMEPLPRCLEEHLRAHAPGVSRGVVGAAPITITDSSPPVVRYRAHYFQQKLEALGRMTSPLPFHMVYTGNFSIGRRVFLDAGGFDEDFRIYGHEDYELALRLSRAGVLFCFSDEAKSLQHYEKDLYALAANVVSEGHTALAFARKHPEVLTKLPLGEFRRGSLRSRAARRLVVLASRYASNVPSILIRRAAGAENGSKPLTAMYDRLFEYLYWIGADRAAREHTPDGLRRSLHEELARLEAIGNG